MQPVSNVNGSKTRPITLFDYNTINCQITALRAGKISASLVPKFFPL